MKHGGFEFFFTLGIICRHSQIQLKSCSLEATSVNLKHASHFTKGTPVDIKFTGTLKHKCFQDKIFKFASIYDLIQLTLFSRKTQSCEPLNMSEIG